MVQWPRHATTWVTPTLPLVFEWWCFYVVYELSECIQRLSQRSAIWPGGAHQEDWLYNERFPGYGWSDGRYAFWEGSIVWHHRFLPTVVTLRVQLLIWLQGITGERVNQELRWTPKKVFYAKFTARFCPDNSVLNLIPVIVYWLQKRESVAYIFSTHYSIISSITFRTGWTIGMLFVISKVRYLPSR